MVPTNKFWRFQAAAAEDNSATLYLYGPISERSWLGDEVTAAAFADDLKSLGDIQELHVRINSRGGDVFAGQAIYSLLKSHRAKVITYNDGLVASIAAVVFMAGDERIMPGNATMNVHGPMTGAWGFAEDLEDIAEVLKTVREGMAFAYQEGAGMTREEAIELMKEDAWLTAEQALELGLVTRVDRETQIAASVKAGFLSINGVQFDLAAFKVKPPIAATAITTRTTRERKGGNERMEITAKVVAEQHPEVHKEILAQGRDEGAKAERARIKALNDLAVPGNEEVAGIIAAAIESGETVEAVAIKIVAAVKNAPPVANTGAQILGALDLDARAVDGVLGAATPPDAKVKEEAEVKAAAEKIAEGANKRRR